LSIVKLKSQMENEKEKAHSQFSTSDLSARRFCEKYWERPKNAIPTKDPTTPYRLQLLFNTLKNIRSVKKVLDAGCGSGFFTNAIKKAGYEAVGIDISENVVTEAREVYKDIEFVCNLVDAPWPFENDSFDVIFSTEVIEHVFGTYEMFSEMNRVLKQGGVLILTTPYHGLIKNLLIVLFGFDRHFNNIEGGHIRFFTKKSLTGILKKFGFEVIETRYMGRIRPVAKSIYMVARKTRYL
jgi:SAM-dependent methyltransferase